MNVKKQAALAALAVDTVAAEKPGHIVGYFEEFRAEGRHVIGVGSDGKEVTVTAMVNGGEGLPTEEDAETIAKKLNMDEMFAGLLGDALQFDFYDKGWRTKHIHREELAA